MKCRQIWAKLSSLFQLLLREKMKGKKSQEFYDKCSRIDVIHRNVLILFSFRLLAQFFMEDSHFLAREISFSLDLNLCYCHIYAKYIFYLSYFLFIILKYNFIKFGPFQLCVNFFFSVNDGGGRWWRNWHLAGDFSVFDSRFWMHCRSR